MRKCNLQFAGQQRNFHYVRRLYFQIVLFITHSHTHICVFYYYYEIDSKLSVQMCGWPCEYVCV